MNSSTTSSEWGLFGGGAAQSEEFTTGLFGPVATGGDTFKQDSFSDPLYGFIDDTKIGLVSPCLNGGAFGASPLRRARSSLGLSTPQAAYQWQHNEPYSPTSPDSDLLPTPRDDQPFLSTHSSSFGEAQANFLNKMNSRVREDQQAAALAQFTQNTPPDERPVLRRRYPTAGAALPSQSVAQSRSSSSQSWSFPPRRMSATLSVYNEEQNHGTGSASSPEEVSQFLNDMDEILGPNARVSPPSLVRARPVAHMPQRRASMSFNVAGVILDEEDMALFSQSPSLQGTRWPLVSVHSSSQDSRYRFQPSFSTRTPSIHITEPVFGRRDSGARFQEPQEYYAAGQSPAHLGFEIQRPRSAPASPDLGSNMGSFAPYSAGFSNYDMPPEQQYIGPSGYGHRRRSSVATLDAIPRSFAYNVPPSHYEYPLPELPEHVRGYQTPPTSQLHSPPRYPSNGPTYNSQGQYASNSASPTSAPSHSRRGSVVSPKAAKPASPKKGNSRGKRAKDSGFSFINFTASDSAKILSGVAPSGTSKRKREDEAAAEEERKRLRRAEAATKV